MGKCSNRARTTQVCFQKESGFSGDAKFSPKPVARNKGAISKDRPAPLPPVAVEPIVPVGRLRNVCLWGVVSTGRRNTYLEQKR